MSDTTTEAQATPFFTIPPTIPAPTPTAPAVKLWRVTRPVAILGGMSVPSDTEEKVIFSSIKPTVAHDADVVEVTDPATIPHDDWKPVVTPAS